MFPLLCPKSSHFTRVKMLRASKKLFSFEILDSFLYIYFKKYKKKSYKDFREPYDSPNAYQHTKTYYYVLVARLAFLVCFEVKKLKS